MRSPVFWPRAKERSFYLKSLKELFVSDFGVPVLTALATLKQLEEVSALPERRRIVASFFETLLQV